MFGSVPLRAVLPDGDIDISFFATAATTPSSPSGNGGEQPGHRAGASPPGDLRDTWASQLLRALEREAVRPDAPFKIRDVQIIQAEVRDCVAGLARQHCKYGVYSSWPCSLQPLQHPWPASATGVGCMLSFVRAFMAIGGVLATCRVGHSAVGVCEDWSAGLAT